MAADINLDEVDINFGAPEFPKDPPPKANRTKKSTSSTTRRGPGRPSNKSKHDEVFDEIKSFLFVINLGVGMRDMHPEFNAQDELVGYYSCVSVYVSISSRGKPELTPEGTAFCEALANIVEDSPWMMKFLQGGDTLGKWMQLGMALYPLGQVIAQNHLPQRTRSGVHETR